jgi:hypothetical protein
MAWIILSIIGVYMLIGLAVACVAGITTREMNWGLLITWLPDLLFGR